MFKTQFPNFELELLQKDRTNVEHQCYGYINYEACIVLCRITPNIWMESLDTNREGGMLWIKMITGVRIALDWSYCHVWLVTPLNAWSIKPRAKNTLETCGMDFVATWLFDVAAAWPQLCCRFTCFLFTCSAWVVSMSITLLTGMGWTRRSYESPVHERIKPQWQLLVDIQASC